MYRFIAYRGFESPSLRQKLQKALNLVQGFFHFKAVREAKSLRTLQKAKASEARGKAGKVANY